MFNYNWKLSDGYPANKIKKHNHTVFSTFACGGGSTMGYKLAGFEVIGANDIDPQMARVYKKNHNPKYYYLESISKFNNRKNIPKDLLNLDILDGSPPCSAFSISGNRDKDWGVEKKFREGQSKQVLDDLFFEFIKTVDKLKPKIVIAENVKGIITGKAKGYTYEIIKRMNSIGYKTQVFLLNGATMGLPQARERVFFISYNQNYNLPKLKLEFNAKKIPFKEIDNGNTTVENKIYPSCLPYWKVCQPGKVLDSVHPRGSFFNYRKLSFNKVPSTITASNLPLHPKYERAINLDELLSIGSFPKDYNFLDIKPVYLVGMSVPPVMMANISYEVYKQWLTTLKN